MLKRYTLPSIKHEGWAYIVIDTEIGFFSAVSDWGNYAFLWSNPGCEFREFLTQLNPDYLHSKLMFGRPDKNEYDDKATKAHVIEVIKELIAEETNEDKIKLYQDELSFVYDYDFYGSFNFDNWVTRTCLEEAWVLKRTTPNYECWGFCTKVMPRFQKMLKEELTSEIK
jgi:hypothetical protein